MPTVIYDPDRLDFDAPGKRHYQLAFHFDSAWGYSLVPITVINGSKEPGPAGRPPGVVAFGGTHGNEWEGQVAVKRLCADLDPSEICGRVILIPQLSESACVANRRVSPLDNVNMNRAFPGDPGGSISYRISNFVKTRIFPRVHVVLDIHSGGNEGGFALCTSFHPIPDPAQRAEIATVAALFDPPFMLIYSSQMASGLLTDEAEAEGKITVGGEFGYGESVSRIGVRHAYEGIKNVLRYYGLMDGEVTKIDPNRSSHPRLVEAANLEDYVPCPRDGIWEPAVQLGDDVRAGDLLGRLHDFSDHSSPPLELRAHRSGVLLMMRFPALCPKGVTLYVIARDVTDNLVRAV
ncbi:MAG: succinylglutamate desuccinylase/aspartoacylase family protein [Bryobacteraceae bacterium]|nr:succinylglutamate desuccinylase/aspartoacylase family protein [Bryobacteraceae bacterium]